MEESCISALARWNQSNPSRNQPHESFTESHTLTTLQPVIHHPTAQYSAVQQPATSQPAVHQPPPQPFAVQQPTAQQPAVQPRQSKKNAAKRKLCPGDDGTSSESGAVVRKQGKPKFVWTYAFTKILVDLWVEKHDKLHSSQKNFYWEIVGKKFEEHTGKLLKRDQMEGKVLFHFFINYNLINFISTYDFNLYLFSSNYVTSVYFFFWMHFYIHKYSFMFKSVPI